jgi:predicted NBD/HSP70 family sugar kinase
MKYYVGLDIGGTKFMAASANEEGNILQRARADTSTSLEKDLAQLQTMIETVRQGKTIAGIGAAIGGPLDWKTGIVSPLHQPAWRDIPLKNIMETQWNCPFFVDVDTNVAALGEYSRSNLNVHKFVYLTLSTGMGGGMLIDGKLDRGLHGTHPEMGHQSIAYRCQFPERILCECGVSDCLEGLISGNGIRRIYQKPAEQLSPEEWDEVAHNLGQGLRNIATLYAPDLIHIGGGVAIGGGEKLIQKAAVVMQDHLRLVPPPEVRLSTLGYDTALLGALTIAKKGLTE